ALKEKQKYGKKEVEKRIAKKVRKILEEYFLACKADKSDHYTVQDMYEALQQRVLEDEIEAEAIPKVSTIQSWIGHYTRQYHKHAAQTALSYTQKLPTARLFLNNLQNFTPNNTNDFYWFGGGS
ncbi:28441_t:CDS:2, partial [Racocetra persica]